MKVLLKLLSNYIFEIPKIVILCTTQSAICFSERICLSVLKIKSFAENQCKIDFYFALI